MPHHLISAGGRATVRKEESRRELQLRSATRAGDGSKRESKRVTAASVGEFRWPATDSLKVAEFFEPSPARPH